MNGENAGQETKYEISADHVWADEIESSTEDLPPVAEVTSHAIEILHRGRDRTNGEGDIRYRYVFEDGEIVGILRSHRLAESNQFDPMGAVAPFEVPVIVRQLLTGELDVDHWTDVIDIDRAERVAEI